MDTKELDTLLAAIDRQVDRDMPATRYSERERSDYRSHLTWHGDDCGC
jgi:hypothetical protein